MPARINAVKLNSKTAQIMKQLFQTRGQSQGTVARIALNNKVSKTRVNILRAEMVRDGIIPKHDERMVIKPKKKWLMNSTHLGTKKAVLMKAIWNNEKSPEKLSPIALAKKLGVRKSDVYNLQCAMRQDGMFEKPKKPKKIHPQNIDQAIGLELDARGITNRTERMREFMRLIDQMVPESPFKKRFRIFEKGADTVMEWSEVKRTQGLAEEASKLEKKAVLFEVALDKARNMRSERAEECLVNEIKKLGIRKYFNDSSAIEAKKAKKQLEYKRFRGRK